VSMSDEPKERNILELILIVRFPCATLDVGHPILRLAATHGRDEPVNARPDRDLERKFVLKWRSDR
jgi:hypothetical protein